MVANFLANETRLLGYADHIDIGHMDQLSHLTTTLPNNNRNIFSFPEKRRTKYSLGMAIIDFVVYYGTIFYLNEPRFDYRL